jgi:hypothetical protein
MLKFAVTGELGMITNVVLFFLNKIVYIVFFIALAITLSSSYNTLNFRRMVVFFRLQGTCSHRREHVQGGEQQGPAFYIGGSRGTERRRREKREGTVRAERAV